MTARSKNDTQKAQAAPLAAKRMRLQKFLADAGVTSRRHAEQYILEGRVLVNDEIVDTLPAFVSPATDVVRFNGAIVRPQAHRYYLMHKPKGVVCTQRDPAGRPRAVDLLPAGVGRLFPVGRLDVDSTGLLLLTNDGELATRVSHPRYGLAKVYRVEVRGEVPVDLPQKLRKGVYLSEGRARASEVEIVHRSRQRSVLEITLREGRNRQIRRMLSRLGHKVRTLKRIRIGPLKLFRLAPGACRPLTHKELDALLEQIEQSQGDRRRKTTRKTKKRSGQRSPKRPTTQKTHPSTKPKPPASPVGKKSKPVDQQKRRRRIVT